jgi:molybdopterin molybdotransferase
MVTFYQFVQSALRQLSGERGPWTPTTVRVRCQSPLRKKEGRVEYYRAVLEHSPVAGTTVRHTGATGSGLLHTMHDANCFIVLPAEAGPVEPGEEVDVQPFLGLV